MQERNRQGCQAERINRERDGGSIERGRSKKRRRRGGLQGSITHSNSQPGSKKERKIHRLKKGKTPIGKT